MQPRHPARDHRLAALLLACALAAFRPAVAQPPEPPTLDDILVRLESNLNQYDSQVPSFLCDEHVVSLILPTRTQQTVTESVFRLKRTVDANHKSILNESRDIKTVNGYPAKGDDLAGPSILSGAFSGGLAVVSLNQEGCMSYKLRPIKPGHPKDPYVVQFTSIDHPENRSDCLLQETGSGRIFIDTDSMQIKRMELVAPRHVLTFGGTTPDGRPIPPAIGVWQISVDYAPVLLGGRTFWMPATIESHMTALPNTWTFEARYTNYHKLEVTTRVLPSTEEPVPPR